MEFDPDRKPYHTWTYWPAPYCQSCGIRDIVQFCADNHPEGCHCQNPTYCPPTREEVAAHNDKFNSQDVRNVKNPCGEVFYPETERLPTTQMGRKRWYSSNAYPFPDGLSYGHVTLEVKDYDFLAMHFTFHMKCALHGRYKTRVTDAILANQPGFVHAQIFTCPTCANPPPKKPRPKAEYDELPW